MTSYLHASVSSIYTALLEKKLASWPAASVAVPELKGKAVQLRVYETPGNRDYIGTELDMEIAAPLAAVEAVQESVEHYSDLLPGFAEIKKTDTDSNEFDIFWEKAIPVFFIKNVRYTVHYKIDRSHLERRIYQGQLKEKGGLKTLDSLLVLEKRGEKTRYYECVFFDGDFGVVSSLAPMKIWRDSVEAILHGALAKKMKAENPSLNYEAIRTQVSTEVKTYPVEVLVEKKETLIKK